MDIVDEIINATEQAEASEGGNRFTYGRYVALVEEIVMKRGNSGPLFIPVFFIDQSINTNTVDPNTGQLAVPLPAGTVASYPCLMQKKPAAANARSFVLSALEKQENKQDPALAQLVREKMRQWAQPGQPMRGLAFQIDTWAHQIQSGKDAGRYMVRLKFKRIPGQTRESVLANRAKLDQLAQGRATQQAQQVAAQPSPAAPAYQPQAPAPAPQGYQQTPPPVYPPAPAAPPAYQPPAAPAPAGWQPAASGYAQPPAPGLPPMPAAAPQWGPPAPAAPPAYQPPAAAPAPAAPPASNDPFQGLF